MARAALVGVVALAVPPWGGGAPLEAARVIPASVPSADAPARPESPVPGEHPRETARAVPVAVPQPERVLAAEPARARPEPMPSARPRPIPTGTGRAASIQSLFDYSVGRFLRW